MKIFLGADHRGFALKEKVKSWLIELGHQYEDCGAHEYNQSDDYPDFSQAVSKKILESSDSKGIIICGSGVGVAVAANRFKGIRAGTAISKEQIRDSVSDEDTNVLAISADYTTKNDAKDIVKIFLETKFSGEERHIRRINKLDV